MTQRTNEIVEHFSRSDFPEECPVCGDLNFLDDGRPAYPQDPKVCSSHCREVYAAEQLQKRDVARVAVHGVANVIKEHNAKCAQCASSPVYCFHGVENRG